MKRMDVHITHKAYKRFKSYRGYIGIKELRKSIVGAISEKTKVGIALDEECVGKVRITGNIYAVIKVEDGMWKVKDFIRIHSRRTS